MLYRSHICPLDFGNLDPCFDGPGKSRGAPEASTRYTHMYVHMFLDMCTHMYIDVCTYTYTKRYMYIYIYVSKSMYMS